MYFVQIAFILPLIAFCNSKFIPSKGPIINEFQCGGALTAYDQGGIFYKYNEEESSDEAMCIWTVTASPNSTFNSLRFNLVSEEFSEEDENFLSFVYPTVNGELVELTRLEHGSAGSVVDIPATIAFVIYTAEFYTEGKGFILQYEGHNLPDSTVEHLPNGTRINVAGSSGTNEIFGYKTQIYSTFVYQHSALSQSGYGQLNLTITDFNTGVGPTSSLDKIDVWTFGSEGGFSKNERLTIQPLVTISGSSPRYSGGEAIVVAARYRNSLVAILRGGNTADYTKVKLHWNCD